MVYVVIFVYAIGKFPTGMAIPVGLAGGAIAIVSGCWLGDKWSPLSDITNLAAAVSGHNVFDVWKYNIVTSGFGGIGAAILIGGFYQGFNVVEGINSCINGFTVSVVSDLEVSSYITTLLDRGGMKSMVGIGMYMKKKTV